MVNKGMKATRMMIVEKKIGRPTCRAARTMVTWGGRRCAVWWLSCRKIASTMISAASTMIPKSMAPSEMRFADSPTATIIKNVNRRAKGTVKATIRAARIFPRKTNRIRNTRIMPPARISRTVLIVTWIRSVRS